MPTFINPDHMTLSQSLELRQYDSAAKFTKAVEKKSVLTQLMPWFATSHGDLHKGVKATSLPDGNFGAINRAVLGGNASTKSYEETIKEFELKNDVDMRILESLSTEDAAKVRAARDRLFSMGFMQSFANKVVTCAGTGINEIMGLLPRRPKLDETNGLCYGAGGTGATNGSILFIRPGEDGVCFRYPSNSGKPNFNQQDMGIVQIPTFDSSNAFIGMYPAYETMWKLFYLLDIFDESSVVRIANIPTNAAMAATQINKIIDAVSTLPDNGQGYFAIAPREVIAQFQKYCLDKNNATFSYQEIQGMGRPMHIFDIPLFKEPYMPANETALT